MENYIAEFKNGNFQNKNDFVKCFLNNDDRNVFIKGFQTFMAVCSHEDFGLLTDFFASCDEDRLQVFLAYVKDSLSLQAVPYLLALLEEWEDTETGIRIHQLIMEMMGQYCDEEISDVEECGNAFIDFSKTHDLNKYYFKGQMINYGVMAKELITVAMSCKAANRPFYAAVLTEVLSDSFGIESPIRSRDMITDEKVSQLFEYVKKIAAINPEPGVKYYFGNKIDKQVP